MVNITAIRNIADINEKHIRDSLIISKIDFLNDLLEKGVNVLDVGTGAGFPGLPLAIKYTKSDFLLIDGTGKKIDAVKEFINVLKLKNVRAIWDRTEVLEKNKSVGKFDLVTARSVSYLPELLEICKPFVKSRGYIVLYKSFIEQEISKGLQKAELLNLNLIDQHIYEIAGDKRIILTFQN